MNRSIKLGRYQHYKGFEYEVLGVAKHRETMEDLVVYKALYGDNEMWVRPLDLFLETVVIDDKEMPRFRFIEE